jgi:hypothetical protein
VWHRDKPIVKWAYPQSCDSPSAAGNLDREKLGRLIFNNEGLRRRLNTATHLPIVGKISMQLLCHWLSCRPLVVRLLSPHSRLYPPPCTLVGPSYLSAEYRITCMVLVVLRVNSVEVFMPPPSAFYICS